MPRANEYEPYTRSTSKEALKLQAIQGRFHVGGRWVRRRLASFDELGLGRDGIALDQGQEAAHRRGVLLAERWLRNHEAIQRADNAMAPERLGEIDPDAVAIPSQLKRTYLRNVPQGSGFIYVVDSGRARKVGVTTRPSPWTRISQYSTTAGPGVRVVIRAVFQVQDAGAVELEIHKALDADRLTGEWYRQSLEILRTTRQICLDRGGQELVYRERDRRARYAPRK